MGLNSQHASVWPAVIYDEVSRPKMESWHNDTTNANKMCKVFPKIERQRQTCTVAHKSNAASLSSPHVWQTQSSCKLQTLWQTVIINLQSWHSTEAVILLLCDVYLQYNICISNGHKKHSRLHLRCMLKNCSMTSVNRAFLPGNLIHLWHMLSMYHSSPLRYAAGLDKMMWDEELLFLCRLHWCLFC